MKIDLKRRNKQEWKTYYAWYPRVVDGVFIWFEYYSARLVDVGHMDNRCEWQTTLDGL